MSQHFQWNTLLLGVIFSTLIGCQTIDQSMKSLNQAPASDANIAAPSTPAPTLQVAGQASTTPQTLKTSPSSTSPTMTATAAATATPIEVFRSASCGCCGGWVEHMQAAGFQVKETITEDLEAIKQEHGVSPELASCHTAIAAGYVLEGHIPATDVQRLLTDKPDVDGIAVPGMPIGSPGMELGDEREPYAVLSFKGDQTATFAEH